MASNHSFAATLRVAQQVQIVFDSHNEGNLEAIEVDRFCWITAHRDRTEHVVSDDAQAAVRRGVYEGLCGSRFLAASMDVGPSGQCPGCRTFLRARNELRDMAERMPEPRPRWLSRLCHRRGRHAA